VEREQWITIKTMAGEIAIPRGYSRCRTCGYTELPFDEILGISGLGCRMTKNFMMEVAFYGQSQSSFSDASGMIKRATGMEVSRETVRNISEGIGAGIFEADEAKARNTIEHMDDIEVSLKPRGTLYVMMDGAAVNTRVQDENGSTWRENKTVMVFRDKDMVKRKNGDHIIIKKEYMPYIGNAEEFKKFVLDAAVRFGYGSAANEVVIAGGAAWIRNLCSEIFPDAVQILDLYHLKENIYGYAKYLYKDNPQKYVPWAEQVIDKVVSGSVDDALGMMPALPDKMPPGVVNLRTYIENNREKINYPEYKAKGFFVGSGAIESANKSIVQRRLKQAGMRWGVKGAQSMLTLRSKDESGLWDKEKNIFVA
jgi:hypothetical protein